MGHNYLEAIGCADYIESDAVHRIPGYVFHCAGYEPVVLYHDQDKWAAERLRVFGPECRPFFDLLDRVSSVFWRAARDGVSLPFRDVGEAAAALRHFAPSDVVLIRYLNQSMGDVARAYNLPEHLKALLTCLCEDTVHSRSLDDAPFINAALGVTIRGVGLKRANGGMEAFWKTLEQAYIGSGGCIKTESVVRGLERQPNGNWLVKMRKKQSAGGGTETVEARRLVVNLTPSSTVNLLANTNTELPNRLEPFMQRDADSYGGGIVVFLGVRSDAVANVVGPALNHHQLMTDPSSPLGDGNNCFISISADGDGAPPGHRTVVISTHTNLDHWRPERFPDRAAYTEAKEAIARHLINTAEQVYPDLVREKPVVYEVGTPISYQRFTRSPQVGGVRQKMSNSNFSAIPTWIAQDEGLWMVSDSVWPGLGVVACSLSSRIAADQIGHTLRLGGQPLPRTNGVSSRVAAAIQRRLFSSNVPLRQPDTNTTVPIQRIDPSGVPTPSAHVPILGVLPSLLRQPEDFHLQMLQYAEEAVSSGAQLQRLQFGPARSFLLVTDPELSWDVLRSPQFVERASFPILDYTYARFMGVPAVSENMGGITFVNGSDHTDNRTLASRILADPEVMEAGRRATRMAADRLVARWHGELCEHGSIEVDIGRVMSEISVEVMGVMCWGESLVDDEGRGLDLLLGPVTQMLRVIQDYLYVPFPASIYGWCKTPGIRKLDQAVDELRLVGEELYEANLRTGDRSTILMRLIDGALAADHCGNEDEESRLQRCHGILMDLLGAGHDTTANFMTFTLALLARDSELQRSVGQVSSDEADGGGRAVLSHAMAESLRLFPLGAAVSRTCVNRTSLPLDEGRSVDVEPGTELLVSMYAMSRLDKSWKCPSEFRCDRDLVGGDPLTRKRGYFPFGGGKRYCVGSTFAKLQCEEVMMRLLKEFRFNPSHVKGSKDQELNSRLSFTLRPKTPVVLTVQSANS